MDFGATWCTARKPVCLGTERKCPFAKDCQANLSDQVLALPQRVVKAKSPEFDCDMLLIRSDHLVVLQKRPSKAIWGGLWSLPESPWQPKTVGTSRLTPGLGELLEAALPEERIGSLRKSCKELARGQQIKHVFTHRRLWMQIWELSFSKPVDFANPDLRWVPLNQLGRYGLPQPIKVLLQGLSPVRGDDLKN
jgi:A/G-specific adenine glycosylase